jgi:CRP-like cAMP-binding protein
VERLLLLRRVRGLASLPPADLAVLADSARERFAARGTALLRAGEPVRAVHLVLEGRVRTRRHGRELELAERGAAVGGDLLLARDPAGLDAIAVTDAVTLELDRESLLDALEDRFGIFASVLREISRELVELLVANGAGAVPAAPPRRAPAPPEGEIDLADRILLLRSRTPFEPCSIDALASVAERAEELRLPVGEPLWRAGDSAAHTLVVVRGAVRCAARGGAPFRLGAGENLGALEALAGLPRWHDAVVEEPLVALRADVEHVLDVLEDHADVGVQVLSDLARTSVDLHERLAAPDAGAG